MRGIDGNGEKVPENKTILIAGSRNLNANDLSQQGKKAASSLLQAGLQPGDAVALILRNDFAYFILHDAARYASFEIVPVNWHLKANELDYILKDCNAKAVLVHADLLTDELYKAIKDLVLIVVPTPEEVVTAYSLENKVLPSDEKILNWAECLDSSEACDLEPVPYCPPLFYTSGTSGQPKAVVRDPVPTDSTHPHQYYLWQ